ncbi:MAG: arginine repressor [Clostridiales bacterium]|nr:arginine repressor [Clostridiales bacterium]
MESKVKNTKLQRQAKILELIEREPLQTQEEVLRKLMEAGFETTQATISRDIKELKLKKLLNSEGEYRYAAVREQADKALMMRVQQVFKASVTSIMHAQNIVVIKTLPGMAQAAGFAVDSLKLRESLGSIAGDDTILIVAHDNTTASRLCGDLSNLLK